MRCYVCGSRQSKGYLCKEHAQKLKEMLDGKYGVIENPTFSHHCVICGEFAGRTIIEYPSVGYFCDRDVEDSINEWRLAE